jgi:hypothetical protein
VKIISCPNCGQPISFLGHQCPYCRIQIVGASGMSKLMRQAGNSPIMMAGGLFFLAFLICILILWKLGMIKGESAEKSSQAAPNPPRLEIRQIGPESIGQDSQGKLSGTWSGKYLNTLGGSGDADLTIQEEAGRAISGRWNGSSLLKARRGEENSILWEGDQRGGPWRYSCRIHENSVLDVTFQSIAASNSGRAPSGAALLIPDSSELSIQPNAAAFSGIWTGFYSGGPETGITSISIQQDKSGALVGAWNGNAPITQAKISGRFLEWECEKGGTHYRNIAGLIGDGNKLVLIYSSSQGSAGSALYSKNQ